MIKGKAGRYAVLFLTTAQAVIHACFLSYGAMGEIVSNRLENDRQILSAAGQCLREGKEEGEFYVIGKNYVPEGTVLESFYGDSLEYSNTVEETKSEDNETYYKMRFAVKWKDGKEEIQEDPKEEGQEKRYWSIGDTVVREIGGQRYIFRCIDQNYKTESTSGQTGALFLCDAVIPADTGSHYEYERQEDGSYQYVFYPGPVVNYGDFGDYKYSTIRQWLKAQEANITGALWTDIGVSQSYGGQTEQGSYSRLQEKGLRSHYIGNQQMTDRLFILSVEEALAYKEYLWRFGALSRDEAMENPDSQTGPFCKGYWLRNPVGDGAEEDNGMAYIVDLVNGMIRPEKRKPDEEDGYEEEGTDGQMAEWVVTSSTGIRPAFVLPQQG